MRKILLLLVAVLMTVWSWAYHSIAGKAAGDPIELHFTVSLNSGQQFLGAFPLGSSAFFYIHSLKGVSAFAPQPVLDAPAAIEYKTKTFTRNLQHALSISKGGSELLKYTIVNQKPGS